MTRAWCDVPSKLFVHSPYLLQLLAVTFATCLAATAQEEPTEDSAKPVLPVPEKPSYGRPALVESKELADFEKLPADRRKLVEIALAPAKNSPWLPYTPGSADPQQGGFDCSGAMYFVMTQAGLTPPRSSAAQYEWLLAEKRLRVVPPDATAGHAALDGLQPGDLLFWSTGEVVAGVKALSITHVAMYLGREKKDGLQVMINATDGRSYRGTQANGYGVYDFRVPKSEARSRLVGYGTPPGIAEKEAP